MLVLPDWPSPGGSVSGVIDLAPGQYLLFDPFAGREPRTLIVGGDLVDAAEPASDLTVELREMAIDLPESAFTSQPMRWKIANLGAMSHEVAVLPVSPDFTAEQFEHVLSVMLSLPEERHAAPGRAGIRLSAGFSDRDPGSPAHELARRPAGARSLSGRLHAAFRHRLSPRRGWNVSRPRYRIDGFAQRRTSSGLHDSSGEGHRVGHEIWLS